MNRSTHISRNTGFKVPDNYFEDESLGSLKSKAVSFRSGFSLPESYFETFDVEVPAKTKVVKLFDYKLVAVAASVLVLAATLLIKLLGTTQQSEYLDLSAMDKQILFNYIEEEMILDYDLYVNGAPQEIKILQDNITSEEVIDYLDDTNLEHIMDY